MQNTYSWYNHIFLIKNIELKNLLQIQLMVLIILEYIISNIIISLIILSNFSIVPKIGQEKIVNTPLKIFDIMFFEYWQVYQIRLFWHIIINVSKKYIYIKKKYFMALWLRRYI